MGRHKEVPQSETTPFYPRSPYGAAKLYAYWITVNYREAYGLHASNGILFNHESPASGVKPSSPERLRAQLPRSTMASSRQLYLGNLDAKRDWGHARDYVEACGSCCSRTSPMTTCLATGECYTVREFAETGLCRDRRCPIEWRGERQRLRRAMIRASGRVLVEVDPRYFRPTEVDNLLGDASKARRRLGWRL